MKKAVLFFVLLLIIGGLFIFALTQEEVAPPRAGGLFDVAFLSTSSNDRTMAGESIDSSGHVLTWTASDAQWTGLGDVASDFSIQNRNEGTVDDAWDLRIDLTFVFEVSPGAPITNMTALNTRIDVSWSLSEVGSPTLSQSGTSAESRDWKTGARDQGNGDFAMNPDAMASFPSGSHKAIEFVAGGVTLSVVFTNSG